MYIKKNYVEQIINGEGQEFEDYINSQFKGWNKSKLKEYCNENNICIKHRDDTKEDILSRIYGSCNSQLGMRILGTRDVVGESQSDFYQRLYDEHFKGKDFSIKVD